MMTTPAYVARMSISALGVLGTAPVIYCEKKLGAKINAMPNTTKSIVLIQSITAGNFFWFSFFLFNP